MSKHEVPQVDFGKELSLVHEAVVIGRKVGADRNFWKALATEPQLMRTVAAVVRNKGKNLFTTQARAAQIMGKKNFFHSEDRDWPLRNFVTRELEELYLIPFPEYMLEEVKGTHILIPSYEIAFFELREQYARESFRDKYMITRKTDKWAYTVPKLEWHLIQKTIHKDSLRDALGATTDRMLWSNDKEMLGEHSVVPSASVLAQAMIAYHKRNKLWLFEDLHVMTSDKDYLGDILLTCVNWTTGNKNDAGPGKLRARTSNLLEQPHGLAIEVRPLL